MAGKRHSRIHTWRLTHERLIATVTGVFFILIAISTLTLTFFIIEGKRDTYLARERASEPYDLEYPTYFPLGVDPEKKEIVEHATVLPFFEEHFAKTGERSPRVGWVNHVLSELALMEWYQNLASLSTRVLIIDSGERREEVVYHFKKILGWTSEETALFTSMVTEASPALLEGKFFPGKYVVPKDASPEEVANLVNERFHAEVLGRYSTSTEAVLPLSDALTIASLLEREAYDFTDMRLIAGVIWNRLFIGMNLQIDATLQYAKGERDTKTWWPQVRPNDKYINSSYNTYEHKGLPPTPIASPSPAAILAALNPKKTECLFYFHDRDAGFHCAETYEEHVALLKEYYGRGK